MPHDICFIYSLKILSVSKTFHVKRPLVLDNTQRINFDDIFVLPLLLLPLLLNSSSSSSSWSSSSIFFMIKMANGPRCS